MLLFVGQCYYPFSLALSLQEKRSKEKKRKIVIAFEFSHNSKGIFPIKLNIVLSLWSLGPASAS